MGEAPVQLRGDAKLHDGVAQKLEALVVLGAGAELVGVGGVGQGLLQ